MFEVEIFPLVPRILLPQPATARTRAVVPPGYGVQEQCLPFAAAAALGFLIPSPIAFGVCQPEDVPPDARPFRSPMELARADGTVIGKFNEEELRAKISAGDFSPGDQYLAEGGEWLRLSRFPGAQFPKEFSHAAPTSPCGNTQSVMKPILTAVLIIGAFVFFVFIMSQGQPSGRQNTASRNMQILSALGKQAEENIELAKQGKGFTVATLFISRTRY